MGSVHHTPIDFASLIYGCVLEEKKIKPLTLETIEKVIDTIFWTSLQKEESESHLLSILITNAKKVDVEPPKLIRYDRWQFLPFDESIELNPHNLTKLGSAASSESALIVVYGASSRPPVIIGLIDQQLAYYRLALHDDSGSIYSRPCGLVIKILGAGHLVASYEDRPIAELRVGEVLHDLPDVFNKNSPIYKSLKLGYDILLKDVFDNLSDSKGYKTFCSHKLTELWSSTFKRLLCEIRETKHGGTILVSPSMAVIKNTCKIKYKIDFQRLRSAIVMQVVHKYEEDFFGDVISNSYLDTNEEEMPVTLYLDEAIAKSDSEDANSAIAGSIKFISTLSRHDGAVLMSPDLSVSGFGVEITTNEAPPKIFSIKKSHGSIPKEKKIDVEKFGTRHRSAIRFCWTNPGSVAFVISQDGGVRAITKLNNKVVIWEDIKLLG
jgi:hypothetical protein